MNHFYDVTKFGIIGDGKTNNTVALRRLTAEMKDGGELYFPAGKYITGSIILGSNTTMTVSAGATVIGSRDYDDFPMLSEFEGLTEAGFTRGGHMGLVTAYRAQNVTLRGEGTIDGNGDTWWIMGKNSPEFTGRPRLVNFILCDNVKILNVSLINSPMWTVHPMCCRHVLIHGISIKNPYDSPNTDGINPESCSDVRISDCSIDVGDDCLTLKSGTENDFLQKKYPCEDITVTGCTMLHGHGGVVIGSEMSGGVRRVSVTGCVFHGTDRGIRIKTQRLRGGIVENLIFSNIIMDDVAVPFVVNNFYNCNYREEEADEIFDRSPRPVKESTPLIRNITLFGIVAGNCRASAMYLLGLPERKLSGIRVINTYISMAEGADVEPFRPIMANGINKMRAAGLYAENLDGCIFDGLQINGVSGEKKTFINCDNISYRDTN